MQQGEGYPEVWREPVRGGFPEPGFWSLPGIEQARAFQRMLVPASPLSRLTGYRLTQAGSGTAAFTLRASPWLAYGDGHVDLCILIDVSLYAAVSTGAPPATEVRNAAMSVNYLRPCTVESETLVARARVVNSGRAFTFAEVLVEDALGRSVAHATGSFLLRPFSPPPPPAPTELRPWADPSYPTPDPHLRALPPELLVPRLFEDEDGLTIFRRILRGELPPAPANVVTGFRFVDVAEGLCLCAMPATEWLCNYSRSLAPGALATMANLALSGSVQTLAAAGYRVGVIDQGFSFVRRVQPDGRDLLARGTVVHQSDDLLVATAEITDADGNRVAIAYETAVLVERRRAAASREPDRLLATVLFTDIVDSTVHAERFGDAEWRRVLDDHNALVRRELGHFRGREIKTAGDGFLATFDSAARGVQCARAIRDGVRRLGIEVRAGLHVGECELVGADIGGIAVSVASRVQGAARPGEVLVSSTVREAAAGSGLRFAERGTHSLKGIGGDWRLYAVEE